MGRRQNCATRLGGWGARSGAEMGTFLGIPVVFVVLGGDDDDYTALKMAMMPVGQKQQMVVSTAMGM